MALSSQEHDLLVETCDNINVAANTCREVLEMLRSLGNTGVVDIATHNNASSVHANATNLFHLTGGNAFLGSKGDAVNGSEWTNTYPFYIKQNLYSKGFTVDTYGDTGGNNAISQYCLSDNYSMAVTDSNHDILSVYEATSTRSSVSVHRDVAKVFLSDKTITSHIEMTTGATGYDEDRFTCSQINFALQSPTASDKAICLEFNYKEILPWTGFSITLGRSQYPFDGAYFRTAPTTTSDRREKLDIKDLDFDALGFIKALKPSEYKVANGRMEIMAVDEEGKAADIRTTPGSRQHWGFVAQDVKEAMVSAGIEDAAVWSLADKDDPESKQSLRYEELIAPLVKAVQILAAKVEALEGK